MTYISSCSSFLSSAARQAAEILLPVAVCTAIEAGLKDQRIGKIVGGVFFIGTGIGVIISSGVPKRLKDRFITKREIDPAESARKTALRYGAATLGLVTTCYGAYNVAMGVMELMAGNENLVPEEIRSICNEGAVKSTKEKLLRCKEGQRLWNEVEADGPFTLCSIAADECPTACSAPENRLIIINPHFTGTEERVSSLVFELNNLKRSKEMSSLHDQRCHMSSYQYATSLVKAECGSYFETLKTKEACGFWQKKNKIQPYTSIEDCLSDQDRNIDFYSQQWHETCDSK